VAPFDDGGLELDRLGPDELLEDHRLRCDEVGDEIG
jgi:hypothetical protein